MYTEDTLQEMLNRYSSEKWVEDDKEHEEFTHKLRQTYLTKGLVGKEAYQTLWEMMLTDISLGRYDRVHPICLGVFAKDLPKVYTRKQQLYILQIVLHHVNENRLDTADDDYLDSLRYVWRRFTIPQESKKELT